MQWAWVLPPTRPQTAAQSLRAAFSLQRLISSTVGVKKVIGTAPAAEATLPEAKGTRVLGRLLARLALKNGT
ncbi:hypothetical protein MesoLjLc_26110 [Mesorhizobium sp. L-8-10]|nr:hypothetical protein MesoLjLb_26610 [Mesorhizobium sp. L-8-3]BCH30681.1 hypothetical protein MesoLjLc_26110 [Mesorhizobium sp. L-8-10]